MINTEIKNVQVIELNQDAFGLDKGAQFVRENGLFVNKTLETVEASMYTYTRTETRKYSTDVIEQHNDLFDVVEYTKEYNDWMSSIQKEVDNAKAEAAEKKNTAPFKPRKEVRKQIKKYEQELAEVGADKLMSEEAKHEARTIFYNLIKALKWVINEDEQVC